MVEAITFDLWDTVINDDSDELEREKRGLRSKRDERGFVVWESLIERGEISLETVQQAYEEVNREFNRVWHSDYVTWTVDERLTRILQRLDCQLTDSKFSETVDKLERMEIDIPPVPVDGIKDVLDDLSAGYPLAVVSDAIVTPGRYLRVWLEIHDLLKYFSGFAFSDEVGHSKPHPDMFHSAVSQLGVDLQQVVHIGDRDHNDIQGAQALGMKAILFTGTRATDAANTTADSICQDYSELPEILAKMT